MTPQLQRPKSLGRAATGEEQVLVGAGRSETIKIQVAVFPAGVARRVAAASNQLVHILGVEDAVAIHVSVVGELDEDLVEVGQGHAIEAAIAPVVVVHEAYGSGSDAEVGVVVGFTAGDAGAAPVDVGGDAALQEVEDLGVGGCFVGRCVLEDHVVIAHVQSAAGGDVETAGINHRDIAIGVVRVVAESGAGVGEDDFGSGRDIDGGEGQLLDAGAGVGGDDGGASRGVNRRLTSGGGGDIELQSRVVGNGVVPAIFGIGSFCHEGAVIHSGCTIEIDGEDASANAEIGYVISAGAGQ